MKHAAILVGLSLAATSFVDGQHATARGAPKPVASLEWLVGGVWTADGHILAPDLKQIETQYTWADNGAYIRFTTHFVTDKTTIKNYDGSFFWNSSQSTLAMWYMDAGGSITQGPVTADGDNVVMRWHGPDFQGKPADLRVIVTRKSADEYRWLVEEAQPDAQWKQVAPTVTYRRLRAH